jgi:hypothetical protein
MITNLFLKIKNFTFIITIENLSQFIYIKKVLNIIKKKKFFPKLFNQII